MLAQKAGAEVLKVIDSPAWYTSWTDIFFPFFFFYFKEKRLGCCNIFLESYYFLYVTIYLKKKKKNSSLSTDDTSILSFLRVKKKIYTKWHVYFKKKFDMFIQSILVNEIKHEIIRVLGIGICFNVSRIRGIHWEHVQVWQGLRPRNLSTMTSLCLTMSWTLTRFEIMNTSQLISTKTRE